MLTITIETENDAFQDGNMNQEIVRILLSVANKIDSGITTEYIKDLNGNTVGKFVLTY